MRKLFTPSCLAVGLLPFALAACTESFTASSSGGGGATTTSAGGATTTTSAGGDTSTGGATGGSTGGSTGGTSTTGTGGAPECMTMADCDTGKDCVNGHCACPNGLIDCNGACVNTTNDPLNCGMCGITCGYSCVGGACNDPVDIAAGPGTTCAVLASGALYCWGSNEEGQFGSGSGAGAALPVQVENSLPPVKRVFIGRSGDVTHVCAFAGNGNLYCWGHNAGGKIGVGSVEMLAILGVTKVTGSPSTTDVALGGLHSLSINNGGLLGWGLNDVQQLGYFGVGSASPNASSGFQGTAVGAGGGHSCVILNDGKLFCFGRNQEGQIGAGNTSIGLGPTEVNLDGDVAKGLALGDNFTCVRTDQNAVRCWGQNGEGQLGLGNTNSPQSSPGNAVNTQGVAVSSVYAGSGHAGAIAGENLYLWGRNNLGQVSPTSGQGVHTTPIKVAGLHVVKKAALGGQHTCVLDKDGTAVSVYCWGGNGAGQLGQNSIGGDHLSMQKVAFPAP